MLSQLVAPQVGSAVAQAAVQQLPEPLTPHIPEPQASFSVQAVPGTRSGTHALAEHQKPLAQSVVARQDVLQLVELAQAKLFGQATGVPAMQAPLPSQSLVVSISPRQLAVPQKSPEG